MEKCEIRVTGLQIKSLEKARLLAEAINTIEEECGIGQVKIILKDMFVCPWINKEDFRTTPMEILLNPLLFD